MLVLFRNFDENPIFICGTKNNDSNDNIENARKQQAFNYIYVLFLLLSA